MAPFQLLTLGWIFLYSSLVGASNSITEISIDRPIAEVTRPCCTFGVNQINKVMGISKLIDLKSLGVHSYQRKILKDNVGTGYSCHGGFIDVSHLRDNADWAGQLYRLLQKKLPEGGTFEVRSEGGFKSRTLELHTLEREYLDSLTEEDYEKIAVSISFDISLFHEIATSFKMPVSGPFFNEMASAFSIEDGYSNLLGAILGARAARESVQFDLNLTQLLRENLTQVKLQDQQVSKEAFLLVRGLWWRKQLKSSFSGVLKRDFTTNGEIVPRLIPGLEACGLVQPSRISIPSLLSNGRHVSEYYTLRVELNDKLQKYLHEIDLPVGNELTQTDIRPIVTRIREHFLKLLGPSIETN